MPKHASYEIRQNLILLLREKPLSYTAIQTKLGTNYDTVKQNLEELKTYDIIEIKEVKSHPENGRPAFYAELTKTGRIVAERVHRQRTKNHSQP